MRYGSVCSGIEAATVAWHGLGWAAAWYSEIEPFPCAVLAHHYPQTPNLGDMTTLPERIRSGKVEAPDILCGGTPCQAFSVAGQRQSLADARGNLTLTFVEIADAIDDVRRAAGHKPSIVVWENVPGVLNTADNAFGCFLAGVAGESVPLEPPGGRWTDAGAVYGPARTVAWRILNAEHFGLAQRRKRVFVVASARDDIDCAAILFEFGGVRRDSPPSREAGQGTAAGAASGAASGDAQPYEVANCLTARMHKGINSTVDEGQTPIVMKQPVPSVAAWTECACCEDYWCNVHNEHAYDCDCPPLEEWETDPYGLQEHGPATVEVATYDSRQHHNPQPSETAQLTTKNCAFVRGDSPLVAFSLNKTSVRRLTPRECERLQGFPDDYTAIPWRKKTAADCPDAPRYKALGNSWAVPVVRWIGQRIADATNLQSPPTVGATA